MTKEALKLALEALESCDAAHITDGGRQWYDEKLVDKAITATKEALANEALEKMAENARELGLDYEPAKEPVAIVDANDEGYWAEILPDRNVKVGQLLYTTPQRKPLTDEEIETYRHMIDWTAHWSYINFARAIEAAHGIKGEA